MAYYVSPSEKVRGTRPTPICAAKLRSMPPAFFMDQPHSEKVWLKFGLQNTFKYNTMVFNETNHFQAGAKAFWMLQPELELKTLGTWRQSLELKFLHHVPSLW